MGEDFLQQIEFVKDLKSVTSFKKIMFFLGVTTFHMYLRTSTNLVSSPNFS